MNADELKVISDVDEFGWHVVLIEEDSVGPGFAYTVGIQKSYGHPEFIVFGLPNHLMHHILNDLGTTVKNGSKLLIGPPYPEILAPDANGHNFDCFFRAVSKAHYEEFLGYALWFYNGPRFDALQLIWPAKDRHYPWEMRDESHLAYRQPLLENPSLWRFNLFPNTAVFTNEDIAMGKRPVLGIVHDSEGDWQFLDGVSDPATSGKIVCLSHLFETDPSISEMANLAQGSEAWRDSLDSNWKVT